MQALAARDAAAPYPALLISCVPADQSTATLRMTGVDGRGHRRGELLSGGDRWWWDGLGWVSRCGPPKALPRSDMAAGSQAVVLAGGWSARAFIDPPSARRINAPMSLHRC